MGWTLLVCFVIVFSLSVLAVGAALRFIETTEKKRVTGMLGTSGGHAARSVTTVIVEHSAGKDLLSRILARFNLIKRTEAVLQQAGLEWTVARLLLLMAISAALGALLGIRFKGFLPFGSSYIVAGGFFSLLPYLYVLHKQKKRLATFESQFPEALDFLARSMRAGHSFTASIQMLANESPPPVGIEFRRLSNEQNLGCSLEVALAHLLTRAPLPDVRFFTSTVLVQRETGGNLSEILSKLASLIRERFKLKGQVKAASAHGRLTALVLGILPIVLSLALFLVAPNYLRGLARDPDGKYIIMGAIMGQMLGYYCMRRIINIRV